MVLGGIKMTDEQKTKLIEILLVLDRLADIAFENSKGDSTRHPGSALILITELAQDLGISEETYGNL
jgi:hypothetical protein